MLSINFLFNFFSILLVITSFMVIYAQHPVFSLLFLISSFLISAIILFTLECEFLALLFIIIYVGAIAILFLFAVMMLDTKLNNLSKSTMKYMPVGFIFGFVFLIPLYYEILSFSNTVSLDSSLYFNSYINWYDLADSISDIQVYGQVLYSYFVLQFLLAGLILLLVIIGIVYLTKSYDISSLNEQSIFKQLSRKSSFLSKK